MSAHAASAAVAKVRRLVPSRLRIIQRDFLTRRGGRSGLSRSAVAVDYTPAYFAAYRGDPSQCPRMIDAEVIHGDEQSFWMARRDFYRSGASRSLYPVWDRQAQALVMMTREVPRIPQEAAFRLFTLGLRMMLLPRLVSGGELLLPSWLAMNAEGLLGEAVQEKKQKAAAPSVEDVKVTKPAAGGDVGADPQKN